METRLVSARQIAWLTNRVVLNMNPVEDWEYGFLVSPEYHPATFVEIKGKVRPCDGHMTPSLTVRHIIIFV